MKWLSDIDFNDLLLEAPYLKLLEDNPHDEDFNIDTLATFMIEGGSVIVASGINKKLQQNDNQISKTLWEAIKKEMLEFICGTDPEYAKFRNKLDSFKKNSSDVILPMIAAYLATIIGVEAASITGFVALIIGVLIKTGKIGFCKFYYN